MKLFKQSILISSLAFYIALATLPANAQTNEPSKSFLTQFEQMYNSLQMYINSYRNEFSQGWGELNNEINKAIQSTVGNLGIPDPLNAGKKIEEVFAKQSGDLLEIDPRTQAENAVRDWNQKYTRGQSQSTLGVEGQKVQAQEAQISNEAVATSSNNAEAAQEDIVTQDILKKIAIQNLQGSIITKSIHAEAQKQSRALAAANINLTDMSSRMDEQSRKEEAEAMTTAREILKSAAALDAFWENQ
ncbi:hypothetical protein [Nostoc sp. CCY0012]|uniref:hypothetical protein n=1 Tax=Nostoc sp. CCY0012 TaxID=1056123 RepID=UPI0039C5F045